ncbi:conjugal transfer protein TraC [candidate division Kazan bacterium RIFCSPLOWO2_01_FULL_48_13]|uniref:Conjugal transfer protein TraC n=1 Tax=candidate division Kazan bacterium RIFCSPLOWO2_01_FULL_48_13 TaxID=1798539 RepID=A0A1F4PNF5_UNCK3|nr:MAG: conjugal transfer protein TraC [candidate division Kazan bacterium RIFCSPLOWO2_01_FULL_48_13]
MALFKRKQVDPELAAEKRAAEVFEQGLFSVRDLIAPASLALKTNYLQLNSYFVRTLFVLTYPQYVETNWLSPIINFDVSFDVSMHIYPMESADIMQMLRRKVTEMESSLRINEEKGAIRDPELEIAYQDTEELRDKLQRGMERFFHYGLYFTVYSKSAEELDRATDRIETALGGQLVYSKQALMQMQDGFVSTLPLATDQLKVMRNMTSSSLATTFPFVSSDLTTNEGILYGINRHNNSLILFDRFKLENANMVVFSKSGGGKSYAVKLEIMRSLMLGTDVFVIDPENEYEVLSRAVGGSYLSVSLNSDKRINPFDLPDLGPDADGEKNLRGAIIALLGLMNLMLGELTPEEDALMDRAIRETYASRDITTDVGSQKNLVPTMEDLYNVLKNMTGAESLAQRLDKYVTGTFAGVFNQPTNFDLDRGLVVFNIRDLEEALRPIGMYIILNYIWNKIRFTPRRRLLVIDEAWIMMQYEDSAKFLYSIAKRARKYWLGLTTITQDVEDFLSSSYGKAVVSNSSLQLLFRQSPASIDIVADTFNLTEGEKFLLLESAVGEGLFFAGTNHAAIKVVASYVEDKIVTSNPEELNQLGKMGPTK